MKWRPIATVPEDERVLVYNPRQDRVFEALSSPSGKYYDPVYSEWDGLGVTHWMPLPPPPGQSTHHEIRDLGEFVAERKGE